MKIEIVNNRMACLMRIIRILKEMDVRNIDYPTGIKEDIQCDTLDITNMTSEGLERSLMLTIVELTY